jgi:hypothetical protein
LNVSAIALEISHELGIHILKNKTIPGRKIVRSIKLAGRNMKVKIYQRAKLIHVGHLLLISSIIKQCLINLKSYITHCQRMG